MSNERFLEQDGHRNVKPVNSNYMEFDSLIYTHLQLPKL